MKVKRKTLARALALTSKIVGNDPKIAAQLLVVVDAILNSRPRNEREKLLLDAFRSRPKDVKK